MKINFKFALVIFQMIGLIEYVNWFIAVEISSQTNVRLLIF
jgi:hypothetical protein